MQLSQSRIEVLNRIKNLEQQKTFDKDVEDDPPELELFPNKIDYLNKRPLNKLLSRLAFMSARKSLKKLEENGQFCIKKIYGLENLSNLDSGAVLTCNHFNALDSFAIQRVFDLANKKHKNFFRVIKEGNYTNPPKGYKFIMRHCNTLPLSRNKQTMRKFLSSVNTILKRGDFVLVYPEQAMWWNYRKPRPLKPGAFKFAVSANVPVVPVFIAMEDTQNFDSDGFPVQAYTIFVSKPIYADESLLNKENTEKICDENYRCWTQIYEDFYNKKLSYEEE